MVTAPPTIPELKVTNMVLQTSLNVNLPLRRLANQLVNVKYNPSRWPGLIWKHHKIVGTVMLFPNGTLLSHGAKTFAQARTSIRQFARLLQRKGYRVTLSPIKTLTITCLVDLKQPVDLQSLSQDYPNAVWEPELFNACMVKAHGIHFSVFSTGRIVIAGLKSLSLINTLVNPTLMELMLF